MSNEALPTTVYFRRSMSTFVADCVVEERHEDAWVITEHPVEQGTTVADHVYKLPSTVNLHYVWNTLSRQGAPTNPKNTYSSMDFLQQLYTQLLSIQAASSSGIISPFMVYTGKRVYPNVLLQNMSVITDPKTENVLDIRASCREVLLVTTQTFISTNVLVSDPRLATPVQSGKQALEAGSRFTGQPYYSTWNTNIGAP